MFAVRLRRSAGVRRSQLRLQTAEGVSAAQTKTKTKSKGAWTLTDACVIGASQGLSIVS